MLKNAQKLVSVKSKTQHGFTLIELMITVAIIAILAAISYPSYTKYVVEAKRSDAMVELLKISQLQEKYYSQHLSYAKNLTVFGYSANVQSSAQGEYQVWIAASPSNCTSNSTTPCVSYIVVAKAFGNQLQRDDDCIMLCLKSTGQKLAYKKGSDGDTDFNSDTTDICWK